MGIANMIVISFLLQFHLIVWALPQLHLAQKQVHGLWDCYF